MTDRPASTDEIEVTPDMIEVVSSVIRLRWFDLAEPDSPEVFDKVSVEILEAVKLFHELPRP